MYVSVGAYRVQWLILVLASCDIRQARQSNPLDYRTIADILLGKLQVEAEHPIAAGASTQPLDHLLRVERGGQCCVLDSYPHWLSDSRRLLFVHQGKLHLIDSSSRKVRGVLSEAPNEIRPHNVALSGDNRLVYFIAENSAAVI